MLAKVNLKQKLEQIETAWVPKIVGEVADQFVKLAKLDGEYVWHQHENEDEMFLVVEGEIEIHLRDGVVTLTEGEFLVVPKGVEHKPVAHRPAAVMLFEPATTRNTGDVDHEYTLEPDQLQRI